MAWHSRITSFFSRKSEPAATPSTQYSAPIGPTPPSSTSTSTSSGTTSTSSGGSSSGGSSYQGPVQQGTSEATFRSTGISTSSYQGPVQQGTSEATFRSTGISSGGSSTQGGESGTVSLKPKQPDLTGGLPPTNVSNNQYVDKAVVPAKDLNKDYLKLGFGEATGMVASNIGGGFKNFWNTGDINFKGTFEPYKYVGTRLSEDKYGINVNPEWHGTMMTGNTVPLQFQDTSKLTLQEAKDYGLPAKYSDSDLYKQGGERNLAGAKTAAETAAIIGVSMTGPVGTTFAGAYVASKSIPNFGKATAPLSPPKGWAGGLEGDYTVGKRLTYAGIGTLQLGLGAYGMYSGFKGIDAQLDAMQIEGLQNKNLKFGGTEVIRGEEGNVYAIYGKKAYGSATQDVGIKLPAFKTGDNTFSITGGKIKVNTKFYSRVSDTWVTQSEMYGLQGQGTSNLGGTIKYKGITTPVAENVQTGSGTGILINKNVLTEYKFSGIVEDKGGFLKVVSGQTKGAKFYNYEDKISVSFKPQNIGVIKKLNTDIAGAETGGTNIISSSGYVTKQMADTSSVSLTSISTAGNIASKTAIKSITTFQPQGYVASSFSGVGSVIKAPTQQKYNQRVSGIQIQAPKQETKVGTGVINIPNYRLGLDTVNIPKTITGTGTAIIPKNIPKSTNAPTTGFPSPPPVNRIPLVPIVPIPVLFIPPFSLGAGLGRPSRGIIKTKAKYGYTPDYRSLVFGIKGKATKGQYGGKFSGFESRPVTSNWLQKLGLGASLFSLKKKKRSR